MQLSSTTEKECGLLIDEIRTLLKKSVSGKVLSRVLLIPPDFTRFYSNAGLITNIYYHILIGLGTEVDILPALGTHVPITKLEAEQMYGDIPYSRFLVHNWRTDVEKLGDVPASFISEISDGLWNEPVTVELNRKLRHGGYDLIISIGQVVPHEVIGMSNHAKNLFVGVGGSDMINKSHMLGAVYGMERMMGRDHTPVRKLFDYALETYLSDLPLLFVLTVTTAPMGEICTHGLFIGDTRKTLEDAVALSQQKNIDFVPSGIQKCVVFLDPKEYHSTWLGNKAIYRTRMAIADGGELIILAPGVERFGEDEQVDILIRKYGYRGREKTLAAFRRAENKNLRDNMGAAAHLIHGSSDGRFSITYAVKRMTKEEIATVGFIPADYNEVLRRYDPSKLIYGNNVMPDGEKIFFVPNPALGLWIDSERFSSGV